MNTSKRQRTLKAAEATLHRIQAGGLPPGLSEGYTRLGGIRIGRRAATNEANARVAQDATSAWIIGEQDTGALRSLTAAQLFERYPQQMEAKFGQTMTAQRFGRGHVFKEATELPRGSPLAQELGPGFKALNLGGGIFLAHKPAATRALVRQRR